jgi:hypothetical protein
MCAIVDPLDAVILSHLIRPAVMHWILDEVMQCHLIRWFTCLDIVIATQTIFTSNDRPAPFPTPAATKIEAAIKMVRH